MTKQVSFFRKVSNNFKGNRHCNYSTCLYVIYSKKTWDLYYTYCRDKCILHWCLAFVKQNSTCVFPRPLLEKQQTLKFTLHSSERSKLCHTCDFPHWNAFLALCTAGLKSNKKLSAHLFEVRSRITRASLHRLCVLLWIMCLCVRGVVPAFPFFSYNGLYCQGQRNATRALGFHQATAQCFLAWVLIPVTQFTSQLLCLCSQWRDIKPRLQFAQWQTTLKARLLLWLLTFLDTLGWDI